MTDAKKKERKRYYVVNPGESIRMPENAEGMIEVCRMWSREGIGGAHKTVVSVVPHAFPAPDYWGLAISLMVRNLGAAYDELGEDGNAAIQAMVNSMLHALGAASESPERDSPPSGPKGAN